VLVYVGMRAKLRSLDQLWGPPPRRSRRGAAVLASRNRRSLRPPARRQDDAPSLLPSPANNIDFNSMTSGAAVPRSVCPATRIDEFVSDGKPPAGELMELLCEDHNGTYALPFPSLPSHHYGSFDPHRYRRSPARDRRSDCAPRRALYAISEPLSLHLCAQARSFGRCG
jgi:hypothetical protein